MAILALGLFACDKTSDSSANGSNPYQEREGLAVPKGAARAAKTRARPMSAIADQSLGVATDAASPAPASSQSDLKTMSASSQVDTSPSMLIRTGQASVEVDKIDPGLTKIRALATQLGGYIANSSLSGGRDQVRSATLELKIPSARYDEAAAGMGGIGKLESINTTVDDVGEEYVDISARVANARRLEERLVNLLATRTGKLEDVLAVERELARVREEIERYDGRLRFLRTRTSMSTLSVTMHEPFPILGRVPGENPFAVAVRQAWRNFVALIAGFIASLGILIPVAVVAGGAWWIFRRGVGSRPPAAAKGN